jgi:hypothetical protein
MSLKPFVYRSGVIVFRKLMPPGTLPVTHKQHPRLRSVVDVLARHGRPEFGQSRRLMLVPGIPEARNEAAALRALCRFKREVERRLRPHSSKRRPV